MDRDEKKNKFMQHFILIYVAHILMHVAHSIIYVAQWLTGTYTYLYCQCAKFLQPANLQEGDLVPCAKSLARLRQRIAIRKLCTL